MIMLQLWNRLLHIHDVHLAEYCREEKQCRAI